MTAPGARLTVLAPSDLGVGFLLAGVEVYTVDSVEEMDQELRHLESDNQHGVIAVYRPLFEQLSPERRRRLELSMKPVVVDLPTGHAEGVGSDRRAQLMERLQRAVGYHITFGGKE